jgi:hypothetical protein
VLVVAQNQVRSESRAKFAQERRDQRGVGHLFAEITRNAYHVGLAGDTRHCPDLTSQQRRIAAPQVEIREVKDL